MTLLSKVFPMAVREALMGILTLGPAYGMQLHAELGDRAPHRAGTNVGQIYATLDRLFKARLVEPDGVNDESLPLWKLTELGREQAQAWLTGAELTDIPEWNELLDVVLVSRSVNSKAASTLVTKLQRMLRVAPKPGPNVLYSASEARYQDAVSLWLGDVRPEVSNGQVGYDLTRPKRGRPSRG